MDSILWQKYLEPLLSDPCRPCVHFAGVQEWERSASKAIQDAWQTCVSEAEGFEFEVREQLSRLIFLLAKHCPAIEKSPQRKLCGMGSGSRSCSNISRNTIDGELTLAKIAESAAISENESLRCFRSMIGSTPIQYVKQVRIQRAAELLISTDRKISDIGAECGLQEMSYFAKTFRTLKGCTPGEFRKRNVHLTENH